MTELDLNITTKARIVSTKRRYKTPKSIRLQQSELKQLEDFKNRLKDLTSEEYCSDTQAFKIMIKLTQHITDATLKKTLSSSF